MRSQASLFSQLNTSSQRLSTFQYIYLEPPTHERYSKYIIELHGVKRLQSYCHVVNTVHSNIIPPLTAFNVIKYLIYQNHINDYFKLQSKTTLLTDQIYLSSIQSKQKITVENSFFQKKKNFHIAKMYSHTEEKYRFDHPRDVKRS